LRAHISSDSVRAILLSSRFEAWISEQVPAFCEFATADHDASICLVNRAQGLHGKREQGGGEMCREWNSNWRVVSAVFWLLVVAGVVPVNHAHAEGFQGRPAATGFAEVMPSEGVSELPGGSRPVLASRLWDKADYTQPFQ
jgi:hypothetical protein